MDFAPLVEKKADRFRELEAAISSPDFYSNPKKATEMMREHTRLKELLGEWDTYRKAQMELKESEELANNHDSELAELAGAEIPRLEERIAQAEKNIQIFLLPPDENEDRDAII